MIAANLSIRFGPIRHSFFGYCRKSMNRWIPTNVNPYFSSVGSMLCLEKFTGNKNWLYWLEIDFYISVLWVFVDDFGLTGCKQLWDWWTKVSIFQFWPHYYHYPYHPCMVYIYTYIYRKNQPNVGKYTIHGWYGVLLEPDHILSEASMNLLHELCKSQPEISLTVSKTCRGKKHISLVSSWLLRSAKTTYTTQQHNLRCPPSSSQDLNHLAPFGWNWLSIDISWGKRSDKTKGLDHENIIKFKHSEVELVLHGRTIP